MRHKLFVVLANGAGFGNRRGVDEADKPALRRLGRIKRQCLANKQGKPIATVAQAIKQRDVGNVDQTDGAGPSGGAAQTLLPKQ